MQKITRKWQIKPAVFWKNRSFAAVWKYSNVSDSEFVEPSWTETSVSSVQHYWTLRWWIRTVRLNLWSHPDLHPTPERPPEDTLHLGEALSVTSSITTPAARQQVRPLFLAAAALSSFLAPLAASIRRSLSLAPLLFSRRSLRAHSESDRCMVAKPDKWRCPLSLLPRQINIGDDTFVYLGLVFPCSTPQLLDGGCQQTGLTTLDPQVNIYIYVWSLSA